MRILWTLRRSDSPHRVSPSRSHAREFNRGLLLQFTRSRQLSKLRLRAHRQATKPCFMDKFRELYIKVPAVHTPRFIATVDAILSNGWTRGSVEEGRTGEIRPTSECFHYVCDKRENRPAALLAIYRRDLETLYVSNVVPKEIRQLTHDQYNAILRDFHDTILTKIESLFPVTIFLSSDKFRIEDTMSAEALARLKSFSGTANQSTGSAHPSDREMWYHFLTTLSREKHKLDSHWLHRWLTEVGKWPPRTALDLSIEFEFGMGLLEFAVKQPPAASRPKDGLR